MPELIPCTASDVDALRELSIRTFSAAFAAMNTPETLSAYLEAAYHPDKLRAELKMAGSHFFFIREDGENCGYLKLNEPGAQSDGDDPDAIEVERIYLLPDYKGGGLGRYMIGVAEDFARSRGVSRIWLGVWEKNESAIAFYTRMGFRRKGEHVFVMGDERQTDYIMVKTIDM